MSQHRHVWAQKLNKLGDCKKISILKKGIGIESEKLWKQGSWRPKSSEKNERMKTRAQGLLYLEQNSKAFAIPILTAI